MRRVLITGGAGFIGHHLAIAWRRRGAEVVILDNFRTGKRENLAAVRAAVGDASLSFIEGSITDRDAVRRAIAGCSVVHHLAAQVSVPESVLDPHACVEINVGGTLRVLEAARAEGVARVVFSSSAAVYGDDPRSPKTEDFTPTPKSPYGITKLDGEHYLRMFAELHGVPTVSLRYFNVFGPRQDPQSVYAAAVPIFLDRALRGAPITVFGDGGATRDFVFVGDVCAANILAATASGVGRGEVFNVAQGGATTVRELAETIRRITDSTSEIVFAPERPGDIRHSRADITRITAALGFRPAVSLAEGLAESVSAARAPRLATSA
jgi:UDP-glucose 4-epimerase